MADLNLKKETDSHSPLNPNIDSTSKGHFGWDSLGDNPLPYIIRRGEKYVAVRMVDQIMTKKCVQYIHKDIYDSAPEPSLVLNLQQNACIRSYYTNQSESQLLNDINIVHCNSQYGEEVFTQTDLIVLLSDAVEFYNFLDNCYKKLLNNETTTVCGFVKINDESVIPYVVRDNDKLVPLFCFEGDTEYLRGKMIKLDGWDLAYLKFCCQVHNMREELFDNDTCQVVSLKSIKSFFPDDTKVEEYWPKTPEEEEVS